MTIHKPFDQTLYDSFDPAKKIIIDYMERNGHRATVNEDKFGIDLIIDDRYYCDVQVKRDKRWVSKFPFSTIHVEPRKAKYLDLDKPTMFCYVNVYLTHAAFVFAKDIKQSRQTEVANREISNGEYFWDVPVSKCKFVKL